VCVCARAPLSNCITRNNEMQHLQLIDKTGWIEKEKKLLSMKDLNKLYPYMLT